MLYYDIILGEKGGTGKSLNAIVTIDYLLRHQRPCLLVDTETSQTPTSTMVARKCGLLEQGQCIRVNAANEGALMDLPKLADKLPERQGHIIIDTGAGSQRLLLPVLPGILAGIREQGGTARVAYLLTAGAESIQAVRKYYDTIRACGDASTLSTVFLFADRAEERPNAYKIMTSVGIKTRYPEFTQAPKHLVGRMPQVLSDCISKSSLLPGTAIAGNGLDIVRRTLLANMLPRLDRLAQVILGTAEPKMPADEEEFLE